MNLERKVEELIDKANEEIKAIDERNWEYSTYSDDQLAEAKKNVQDQIDQLENIRKSLKDKQKKIADLQDELDGISEVGERKKKKEEIKKAKKELKVYSKTESHKLNKPLQGKVSNIVSTYIGQIDKRIHNRLYANNNKRWDAHVERVNNRYSKGGVFRYLAPRLLVVGLGVLATTFAPGSAALIPLMFGPAGATIFNIINVVFASTVLFKAGRTIYNKIKFGGPQLQQKKRIYSGTYLQNIEAAFDEYDAAKAGTMGRSVTRSTEKIEAPEMPVPSLDGPAHSSSFEKERIISDIVNEIGMADVENYTEELDDLYERALGVGLNNRLDEFPFIKDKFIKMEQTVRNGRFAKETTEDKEEKPVSGDKEEKPVSTDDGKSKLDPAVKNLIAKVGTIDPNNLDRALIDECIEDLNNLNNKQRAQVPQSIYLILGKARNMCDAMGKTSSPKKDNVHESELNKLIERVDLDKINSILKTKSLSKLTQNEKRLLHDELVDIRNILNIISSENVKNTSLDGKNIAKLNQIISMFGNNSSKVNEVIPNRVVIELFDVTDKTGRTLVGFSGNCEFYSDDKKCFERMIPFKEDDEDYIKNIIQQQIYGFDGEVIIKKNKKSL